MTRTKAKPIRIMDAILFINNTLFVANKNHSRFLCLFNEIDFRAIQDIFEYKPAHIAKGKRLI